MNNKVYMSLGDARANIGNAIDKLKFMKQTVDFKEPPPDFPIREVFASLIGDMDCFLTSALDAVNKGLEDEAPETEPSQ